MKRMKDFVEISREVDRSLPEHKQKEQLCDLLLREFAKMKGQDLAPYLVDYSIDLGTQPAQRLLIRFPFAANVFNPQLCDIEGDGEGDIGRNGGCQDKI